MTEQDPFKREAVERLRRAMFLRPEEQETPMTPDEAARLLFETYCVDSGASLGAGRILKACHTGDGAIKMEDLFRFDARRRGAAFTILMHTIRYGVSSLNLSSGELARLPQEDEQ